jgi:pilus assembly protein FimV
MPNKAAYDRLGISQKILELNPQAMVYRNRSEQLMVLVRQLPLVIKALSLEATTEIKVV